MTKFALYQIKLTADQVATINAKGHDAVPAQKIKLDMVMDFSGDRIGGTASEAWEAGYYTHVANITAEDYNQAFEIGNIGPEQSIERLTRMSSISVGDVIVGEDGTIAVVASNGFVGFSFNPKMAA